MDSATAQVSRMFWLVKSSCTVFLSVFGFYIFTMHASYGIPDSTEFMGAGWTLGVAHPSGYPMFLMIERLLGAFAVGDPAVRLHLLGPLAGAILSVLVYRTMSVIAGDRH